MIHLYIDTNAYLTFFHLTNEDLEELKKLKVLIEAKEIRLYLPEQTFDEFNRNRDTKIADALKRYKEEKLNNQFPQICKDYPEFIKMREAINIFDKNKGELLQKLSDDIFNHNLAADKIIDTLFQLANRIKTTRHIIHDAKIRYDLGRPPGKNKSYGDAVNWEILIDEIPEWEALYFISDDKDFYSEIDSEYFNPYLLKEWKEKKNSDLFYYKRLSSFFKDKYPHIKIASDFEREKLIAELNASHSYAMTHFIMEKLSKFQDFSSNQMNDFLRACINNNQIHWIKDDSDIKSTVTEIVRLNKEKIEPDLKKEMDNLYDYTKSI